ncbi:MAG: hypothetical protein ABI777_12900 [Betaproteobacteria bacterium]
MIRTNAVIIVLAFVGVVAGCNETPTAKPVSPPGASVAVPPPAASAPPFVAVPIPAPTAGSAAASETAKDTAANNPKGTLSKEEESKSMPMAGQANNHSSPSLDAAKK